jgi:uncharacterized tellurite resistance protein B-like protein
MLDFSISQYLANKSKASDEINEFHSQKINEISDENWRRTPPMRFDIKYESEEGHQSERCLVLIDKSMEQKRDEDIRFRARCEFDNENEDEVGKIKTYLAKRVIKIINPLNGYETTNCVEYFRWHPMLNDGFNVIECPIDAAIYECLDEIYLLVALAKIDGDYHENEYDSIINFLDHKYGLPISEIELKSRLALFSIDLFNIEASMQNLIKSGKNHSVFRSTILRLIEADGQIQEGEAEFAKYIMNSLVA